MSDDGKVIDFQKAKERRGLVSHEPDAESVMADGVANLAGRKWTMEVGVVPTEHGMVPWYLDGREFEMTIENARKLATKFNLGARYVERELWRRANRCSWCGGEKKTCACEKKRNQKRWGWYAKHWRDDSTHEPVCETRGNRPVFARKREEVSCKRCLAKLNNTQEGEPQC